MDEHGQAFGVDSCPDSVECRIDQVCAAYVCDDHDADRARRNSPVELLQCQFLVLPRQRGKPCDAIGSNGLLFGHRVIDELRCTQARAGVPEVSVRAGQGHDCEIDPGSIHVLNPDIVVQHRRENREERSAVHADDILAGCRFGNVVARPSRGSQKIEVLSGQHMRMHVDDCQ